ncbi:MAG TPA: ABC transporter permease, partial [Gemmatimonadaceae bacterium]|nr:ABC transporter permease [Gemmatimonadaceae bacterium]
MSIGSKAASLWRNLFQRERRQQSLDDELRSYVDLVADEFEREGMTREAARQRAMAEAGVERSKELTRDTWTGARLDAAAREVKHTIRSLKRAPLFVCTVVLTLGIAIGGATALFTIIKGSLMRPLPGVAEPDRLVSVEPVRGSTILYDFSYPDLVDFREQATTLSSLALYDGTSAAYRDSLETGRAWMSYVSGEFFTTLGVHAAAGRLLSTDDVRPETPVPVAVIGYDFWQRHFHGDAKAVGATIRFNDYPLTVVGVAPAGFIGAMALHPMDLWVPLTTMSAIFRSAMNVPSRSDATGRLVARLAPGRTVAEARQELTTIASRLAATYPEDKGRGVLVYGGTGMTRDERVELRRLPIVLSA